MKTYIKYLPILILAIGCQNHDAKQETSHSTAIALVTDFTDKNLWPVVDPILELYQCEKQPNAEAWFHFSAISDKKLNPYYSVHLPDGAYTEQQNTEDDPQARSKAILSFYAGVRQSFTDMYKNFDTTKSFGNSECFASICKELHWLRANKSENKVIIIVSDLMEKSTVLNAYRDIGDADVTEMAAKLNRTGELPNKLNGITMIFVYRPVSRESDLRFDVMLSVFRNLFEKRGAKIQVQATNSNYLL